MWYRVVKYEGSPAHTATWVSSLEFEMDDAYAVRDKLSDASIEEGITLTDARYGLWPVDA